MVALSICIGPIINPYIDGCVECGGMKRLISLFAYIELCRENHVDKIECFGTSRNVSVEGYRRRELNSNESNEKPIRGYQI